MVPLVMTLPELDLVQGPDRRHGEGVEAETGDQAPYQVGTMIELPRAALQGREIAKSGGIFLLRHQ
jgi:pyruvate, orthophosphate dikinase